MTTTSPLGDVARQIRDELADRAWRLHICGLPFADPVAEIARTQLTATAAVLAGQLCQDTDDRLAGQTCIDLMCTLWPHGAPEDVGRADWWQTPLGRACARSLGRDDAEAVTQEVAAAMLGLARTTVATMLVRGNLDRHPDGGVLRASVLQRLAGGEVAQGGDVELDEATSPMP